MIQFLSRAADQFKFPVFRNPGSQTGIDLSDQFLKFLPILQVKQTVHPQLQRDRQLALAHDVHQQIEAIPRQNPLLSEHQHIIRMIQIEIQLQC